MWISSKHFLSFVTIIWQVGGQVIEKDENYDKNLLSSIGSASSKNNNDSSEMSSETSFFDRDIQQMKSETSLEWLTESEMKIIWPNQGEDIIHLTASKLFQDSEHICIFEGNPQNESETIFSAAIIGCLDSEETIVNVAVNNTVLELLLLNNGTTFEHTWNDLQYSNKSLKSQRGKRDLTGRSIFGPQSQ